MNRFWKHINTPFWTPLGISGLAIYWLAIVIYDESRILSFLLALVAIAISIIREFYDLSTNTIKK